MSSTTIIIDGNQYPKTIDGLQAAHDALPSQGGRIIIPRDTVITNENTQNKGLSLSKSNVTIEGEDPLTSVIQNSQSDTTLIKAYYFYTASIGKVKELYSDRKSFTIELTNQGFYMANITKGTLLVIYSDHAEEIVAVESTEGYKVTLQNKIEHVPPGEMKVIYAGLYLENIHVKNLTFRSDRSLNNAVAVDLQWCIFSKVSKCSITGFHRSGLSMYMGYKNSVQDVSTFDSGSGLAGGTIIFKQKYLTLNNHRSERDYFSLVLVACIGMKSDLVTVIDSKKDGTAGRAFKFRGCHFCSVDKLVVNGSEDVGVFFDVGTVGCMIRDVTVFGGDIQLDYVGLKDNPTVLNVVSNAYLEGATTRGVWADDGTASNFVYQLSTQGGNSYIVADFGLNNVFTTTP